jgi:predicted RNase H-like HicB family nuclease
MLYPVAIEKGDEQHACNVVVPDLPGCFSAGDTMDEAITNAREAILMMLENYLNEDKPFPEPILLEEHRGKPEFKGWIWALVDVDLSQLYDTRLRGPI